MKTLQHQRIPLFVLFSILLLSAAAAGTGCGPGTDRQRFEALLIAVDQAQSQAERDALVEAFFPEVAYSDGFPIEDGESLIFAVDRPDWKAPPVRLSGDFNGWDPDSHPLDLVPGTDLFYTTVPASAFGERSRYKFVYEEAGDGDWVADPNARRFDHDGFGEISIVRGGPAEGHLERYRRFEATALGNTRDVVLYLPPGYEQQPSDTYPVLYMHDGQNLFDPTAFFGGWNVDEHLDALITGGQVEPLVVVGMDNTPGRFEEYTHVEDTLGGARHGGEAHLYLDFVVNDLKPFVDDRYATRPGREETGIMGSSLGGLVSLWAAFTHGDTFSRVGGMSSTLGWGSLELHEETVIELAGRMPIFDGTLYFDSGGGVTGDCYDSDGDGIEDDNPSGGDNYCETLQLRTVLRDRGYTEGTDFHHWWEPWAPHNEAAWSERLPMALEILFPG